MNFEKRHGDARPDEDTAMPGQEDTGVFRLSGAAFVH
jgi:hypothetical protein